jgi:hypothetical protein
MMVGAEGFEDDEIGPVLRADVVQTADIGMCEQTDGSCFALKASFQIRIGRKVS